MFISIENYILKTVILFKAKPYSKIQIFYSQLINKLRIRKAHVFNTVNYLFNNDL